MAVHSVAHGDFCLAHPPVRILLSSSRHKNVTQETRDRTSRVMYAYNADAVSIRGSSQRSLKAVRRVSSKGMPSLINPASSSTFLSGDQHGRLDLKPILRNRRGYSSQAQARTSGLSYPKLTEKPEWWMRVLAATPYLIACQISDAAYYLHPFLEHHEKFENLIFYIPGAFDRWSVWFPMVYCLVAYSRVVKNKRWPHFLRHHLIMGMLLETALQVVWITSNWFPLIHYNGTFGMYYWAAVGFLFIGVLVEGIRCALAGNYFKVPFVSDAALIHTNYNVGSFHRPF